MSTTGIYKCQYEFQAESKKELSLKTGDIVKVTRQINPDWYFGITAENQDGLFPASYVEQIFDFIPDRVAIATNHFTAEDKRDLELVKNDVVIILKELDSNWYQGSTNKSNGIFPVAYVSEIFFGKNNKSSTQKQKAAYGVANQNFQSQDNDELSITKGIHVELVREIDSFWMLGRVNNKEGKFPKSFIDIIIDLPEDCKIQDSSPSEKNGVDKLEAKAKAKFMFVGTKEGELSFDKGEIIFLTERINNDWLEGKIGNTIGIFPANHVQILVDLPYKNTNAEKKLIENHTNNLKQTTSKPQSVHKMKEGKNFSEASGVVQKRPPARPQPSQKSVSTNKRKENLEQRKSLPNDFQINNNKSSDIVRRKTETSKPNTNKLMVKKSNSFTNILKKPLIASKPDSLKVSNKMKSNSNSYEFQLTEEKLFDLPTTPTKEDRPIIADKCFTLQPKRKAPVAPKRNQSFKNSTVTSNPQKGPPKLPKPLAPMPAIQNSPKKAQRPNTLPIRSPVKPLSPNTDLKAGSLSVSFKQYPVGTRSSVDVTENLNEFFPQMSRSETDPQLVKNKIHHQTSISGDTVYFSSARSSPMLSPDHRKSTLDAVLSKGSMHSANDLTNGARTPSDEDQPLESLQQRNSLSLELKRVENEIVELKSKLEEEAHLLSGVETLLDFVSPDKLNDLLAKKDKHNSNIVELNNELNALEDEKSYLLASFGQIDDIKNRVNELEKQIDMYLDNCEQLRRMQDVAVMEDLPEIRDSIEFCENMVDTLQSELNGLKVKLGDLDQPDGAQVVLDEEDGREKKKRKQKKVIEELTLTEQSYVTNISLVVNKVMKELIELQNEDIDVDTLFGNLSDIVKLSEKLSKRLNDINKESMNDDDDDAPQTIAQLFLDVAMEMKECYAVYCRNYDDAQMLLEKYEEDSVISLQLKKAVDIISNDTGCFGLSSLLIKPVQRVLKYPLLLSELIKCNFEGDKDVLVKAFNTVTDVATAINEFKRRKDLVQKYRDIEDGLGKRVQKLNWHSVAKKTNRINQRITQFTGLNSQTVDERFLDEERRFRSLEKLVKSLLKNTVQFIEEFKEYSSLERQSAESLFQQSRTEKNPGDEIVKYYSKVTAIAEVYANEMVRFIEEHVNDPLSQLLQLFQGPFRLIQKRNDKCLDYDRAKNKAAKDAKEKDKIKQSQEELQTAENVYTALNVQLLEELPALSDKCASFIQFCLANFVEAYRRYFSKAFRQFKEIWELPFIDKSVDLFAVHQERVQEAAHQLSTLIFVPTANSSTLNNRRSQTQVVNMTNFFVEFGGNHPATDATDSKPLIDFSNEDEEGDIPDQSNHFSPPITKKHLESPLQPRPISSSNEGIESTRCILKYDFEAEDQAEISAKEGSVVTVLRRSDKHGNSEWWFVEYQGKRGYIAASYLEPMNVPQHGNDDNNNHDLANSRPARNQSEPLYESVVESSHGHVINYDDYYELEYDFEGINKGELTAKEGQVVHVIHKQDQKGNQEWWQVEFDGNKGYVPRNYLNFVNRVPIT